MRVPKLAHFHNLSTNLGIYQHCIRDEPDRKHGYSIDDNARAMICAVNLCKETGCPHYITMADNFFSYISRAQRSDGTFHNFADYTGKFTDSCGSETSWGRVIWGLGYYFNNSENASIKNEIRKILSKIPIGSMHYTRSLSYAILGLTEMGMLEDARFLCNKILKRYDNSILWFEKRLTYANAIIPYSLINYSSYSNDAKCAKVAFQALKYLDSVMRHKKAPCPVGNKFWRIEKKSRYPLFDQQVIDAADMVIASAAGYKMTNDRRLLDMAYDWMSWFLGNNVQKACLINDKGGGIYDGITASGLNKNQGAESLLCYLIARNQILNLTR